MTNVADLDRYRQEMDRNSQASRLKSGGPGGTFGDMEAKIAKLEAQMSSVIGSISELKTDVRELRSDARSDFRVLFGALIVAALGLASLMAKGFKWL